MSLLSRMFSTRKSLPMQAILNVKGLSKTAYILEYGSNTHSLVYEMHKHGYENTWGFDPHLSAGKLLRHTKWNMIMLTDRVEHLTQPAETLLQLKQHLFTDGQILLRHTNLSTKENLMQLARTIDMRINMDTDMDKSDASSFVLFRKQLP